MHVDLIIPDWIRDGQVTLNLSELNPVAVEALIETLRDASPKDDDRVRLLTDLWDALTGD